MPKLNWLDNLSDEQVIYADMVAQKAQAMGVPKELALSIAFHGSGLDPRKIGEEKKIGLMQVLPSTAREMGYTPGDMHDPAKNIEAGLKYLKSHLDTFGGAPELAALAYNRGPETAHKFIAGEEDPAGQQYVKNVQGLGGFSGTVDVSEPPPIETLLRQVREAPVPEAQDRSRQIAGGIGAGLGAIAGYKDIPGRIQDYLGRAAATGQALAAGALPQAAAAPGAMPQAAPTAGALPGAAAGPTGPGSGVAKYGINLYGLPEGEAKQALDMTKQPGGATDLATKRREALMEIRRRFPGEQYGETTSGLMTPVDKEEAARAAVEEWKAEQVAKQQAIQAQQAAEQAAAEARTPLGRATQTFRGMMSGSGRLLTRLAAPLSLFGTATEGMALAQEASKPSPDVVSMGASGLGALGGVAALFPPTALPGAAAAIAGPEIRRIREQTRAELPGRQAVMQSLQQPGPKMDMSGMMRGYGATVPTQ